MILLAVCTRDIMILCLKFLVDLSGVIYSASCVNCSTFGSHDFSVARPTVRNSLPDELCDPAVDR